MILPPFKGNLDQSGFFVYAACDPYYFDCFAKPLINSIKQNTKFGVHLHLYNPSQEQVTYCRSQERVSVTFEDVPIELFTAAAAQWLQSPTDSEQNLKYKRILNAMSKSNDTNIQGRIQRTYFACARFIRLFELINSTQSLLSIDIDAVVLQELPLLSNTNDFYIHHIEGKKARYLAGGLYLPGTHNGYDFLKTYATVLKSNIEADNLYWGIDQDVLDDIVPKYHWAQLPMSYIDWGMQDQSYIWTAKGARKELEVFTTEQKKYNF